MKKILYIILLLIIFSNFVFAGGIGYIDYEQIFNNFKLAQKTAKEIQDKEKYLADLVEYRQNEYDKLDSPVQKQKFEEAFKKELIQKEKEYASFREKKEEDVYSKIHAVTEKIRLEKGYDAILDSRGVFSGGEDITKAVIDKLNEHQR